MASSARPPLTRNDTHHPYQQSVRFRIALNVFVINALKHSGYNGMASEPRFFTSQLKIKTAVPSVPIRYRRQPGSASEELARHWPYRKKSNRSPDMPIG
jgi:hypothetical protein